jgi:outer membrane protein TolC
MSKIRYSLCALALLATTLAGQAQTGKGKPRAKQATPAPAAAAPAKEGESRCGEEDALPSKSGRDASFEISNTDPRAQLQELVQMAQTRSLTLGASTLLAQAARDDWEEARAARLPAVSLGGTLAHAGNRVEHAPNSSGLLARGTLSVGAPLYDFGRIEQLAAWRSQLAESARQGLINAEQQLALQTVALAMDRSRYQLQIQVYGQYVRKMGCLVEALESVVKVDRGRASELVQAQKNRQQAELAVEQTMTALRQTETRLRRFVGDQLPASASYAAVLTQVPSLTEMQADVLQAAEVAQLSAQAQAQARYADSVAAGHKPQINWLANGTGQSSGAPGGGKQRQGDWVVGLSVTIPIYTPGADASIAAARKRAEAARLQRDDAIEGRRYRVADMHEAATSSFDRARSIVEILRNSDRLRASTLQQWQQLGRRSLFDVMGAEADYYSLRVAHVNAIFDGQQAVAMLWSLGRGVMTPLR